MQEALTLLNGLTPTQFMTEYWQKKPLLIRGAIPGFKGLLTPDELAGLACETEVPSRLIQFDPEHADAGAGWQVAQGPFEEDDFAALPSQHWTLLVQGMNHILPEAQALLARFNFIPTARLDDVMVSYAPTGGGVGPHIDSYDVFLLQGAGKRRWSISQQNDLRLIPDAPLRILSHFVSEQEWVLEPGDMLYLPPNIAHWGVAEDDDCMTYSIGFRAPAARELAVEFLDACRQEGLSDELYRDPELQPVLDAAAIDQAMVKRVSGMLQRLTWQPEALGPFLARYFTEPKAYVVFTPNRKLSLAKFTDQVRESGVTLDLQTQMLHWQGQYFINGEVVELADECGHLLNSLANQRQLGARLFHSENAKMLLAWLRDMYLLGYLHLGEI
ncbi:MULTISPECIES: cupin domain-containing protein [unclassified Methylophilus]|uniref:cupin domain-containing protein n=1 Tax=unclassified Methylophilus TaxID=2630143 RepID=UPI0006F9C59A|nr:MULTISPECIES: cupin domain-containing protein [unclassified Methylophilus]KQT42142.1 cupin [Methylophilus sp. Leaf416]KQT56323.1 cupin [Methylophilus sp. Leaf459]